MGYGSKLNISIKNERIEILEKRAAAIESILNQRIDIFITLSKELKDLINGLLTQEISEIKKYQEIIYEELISGTLRGRMKRLKELLRKSNSRKGDKI